jgi:hypothetical protein
MLPESGAAFLVSNRQDHDPSLIQPINDLVGEPRDKQSSRLRVAADSRSDFGLTFDALNRHIDSIG